MHARVRERLIAIQTEFRWVSVLFFAFQIPFFKAAREGNDAREAETPYA